MTWLHNPMSTYLTTSTHDSRVRDPAQTFTTVELDSVRWPHPPVTTDRIRIQIHSADGTRLERPTRLAVTPALRARRVHRSASTHTRNCRHQGGYSSTITGPPAHSSAIAPATYLACRIEVACDTITCGRSHPWRPCPLAAAAAQSAARTHPRTPRAWRRPCRGQGCPST